jgi:hypothetical protein
MGVFSAGDIFFIVFILCVIHGIMLTLGFVRRRKIKRNLKAEAETTPPTT